MAAIDSAISRAVRWLEKHQEKIYRQAGITPTVYNDEPNLNSFQGILALDNPDVFLDELNDTLRMFPGSRYDSAISRFNLCKILRHAADINPLATKPSIVVGTSPSLIPNAFVALNPKSGVNVIVHNSGFSLFFYFAIVALLRLVDLPYPISDLSVEQLTVKRDGLRQDMIGAAAPLMLKAMIMAATGKVPLADFILEKFFRVPGHNISITKEEGLIAAPIVDCADAFIVLHEFAHAMYDPSNYTFGEGFGPPEMQELLRYISANALTEFDADLIGANFALNYSAHRGLYGPEYSCLGILLFFDLMRLQRRAIDAIRGVHSRDEAEVDSFTHPPLIVRRDRVVYEIGRLNGLPIYTERGLAITNTFSVAIEFIWENTRPFLEQLHKSGLEQHLAPECHMGWLSDDFKSVISWNDAL